MTTNLFVIANVKQLRIGGSFRILLLFFPNILGCWRPKFSNFNSFHNRIDFGTILEGLRNFGGGGGGLNTPNSPPPRYATDSKGRRKKVAVYSLLYSTDVISSHPPSIPSDVPCK